ncbi:hypothetical protein F66182_5237 [Fusarium sp. NRRL 66182]|nr:hypothetical protein F66182_5237 [Fusarium sp. NRRL 66182]
MLRLSRPAALNTLEGHGLTWSQIILIPFTVINQLMIENGIGRSVASINQQQIPHILKNIFVWQIIYMVGLAAIKASILFFFLRIFPDRRFRIVVWITVILNTIATAGFFISNFAKWHPFSVVWEGQRNLEANGLAFMNAITMMLAHCIFNFVLDVWMLILPMTQIFKLGLLPKKKMGVVCMFGLGVFLTIISIMRTVILSRLNKKPGRMGTSSQYSVLWGSVELYVGVVVACVPHARQLYRAVISKTKLASESSATSSIKPIFVNRSLAPIEDEDDMPALHDEGGLIAPSRRPSTAGVENEVDVAARQDTRDQM